MDRSTRRQRGPAPIPEPVSETIDCPWQARLRPLLTMVAPAVLVATAFMVPAQFSAYWPGLVLVAAGQGFRLWAAGCLHKDQEVTDRGPFACTRNPLYVGSFTIGVGQCLMSGLWWTLLLLPLFWLVYYPTIRYEEQSLRRRFGEAYAAYSSRTPRVVPRLPPLGLLRAGFSWRQLLTNREYEALLANAAAAVLFALAGRVG